MIEPPENYDLKQAWNDILFLGVRLKHLEDTVETLTCGFLDVAFEFYGLRMELNRAGGNWTRFIFHQDCTNEQRQNLLESVKRLPPLQQDKELKAQKKAMKILEESSEGITQALSLFSSRILTLEGKMVDKQEQWY